VEIEGVAVVKLYQNRHAVMDSVVVAIGPRVGAWRCLLADALSKSLELPAPDLELQQRNITTWLSQILPCWLSARCVCDRGRMIQKR
jgi:hypothetical protein